MPDQTTDERQAALNAYWAANTPAEETAAMDRMLSLGMLRGDEEQLASRFPGLVSRREVMDLIESEIPLHSEVIEPNGRAKMADWQVHQRVAARRPRQIGQPGGWQYAKIIAIEGEDITVRFERDGDVQTVPTADVKLRNVASAKWMS